ncbi:unnamed protein product [Didymodactylos carnosus]|uniref:PB1 domain-containing protein n=1 Tax=Didymodactylos carnosus TaxID=1234261 RepID=A0A814JE36_9BILA|nr:unnamed protein product [Didymodactylos carnosus]CAF1036812.1 unnamed protein product [Didymodactylos carnosus]CAF3558243.1 unnamed protein product [Didymodactylos carnosus]CAF3807338.1 unnamed protein product [Didymodactylos carnosus]
MSLIAIDITPLSNIYRQLLTKVITYNPNIQADGFKLQYVDNENERITFSTVDELKYALATKEELLKIFNVSKFIESAIASNCDYCCKEIIHSESYKVHNKPLCKICSTRQQEQLRSLKISSSKYPHSHTTSHPYHRHRYPRYQMSPSLHNTWSDIQYTPYILCYLLSSLTSITRHIYYNLHLIFHNTCQQLKSQEKQLQHKVHYRLI